MSVREIEIFRIGRTTVDRAEVRRWLDHVGAVDFEIPGPEAATDPALLVALAAKRCYMSFVAGLNPNVNRVRSDYVEYFDNILASGHGSVLEHAVFSFAIEGVSRVFTAEMNRHRAGWAISEGSQRFIRFERDVPYWLPLSIRADPGDDADLAARKEQTREFFAMAFNHQQAIYAELLKVWEMDEANRNFTYKKKITSLLRRIIGIGCATGGVWSGNVRALRHVLTMRCAPAAEEEICHVFSRIAKLMAEDEPMFFGDFHEDDQGFWRPKYVKV